MATLIAPHADESLLSWLSRFGASWGLTLREFIIEFIGYYRHPATLEFNLTMEHLKQLHSATTQPIAQIKNLALNRQRMNAHRLFKRTQGSHWLLPSNSSQLGASWSGYCPLCLKESAYLRKHWRMAFYVTCAKHQVEILDTCPQCGRCINPEYLTGSSLDTCHYCDFKLACAKTRDCSNDFVVFQDLLANQLRSYHNSAWPRFLWQLIRYIRAHQHKLLVKDRGEPLPFSAFETLPATTRRKTLETISGLLADWPQNLSRSGLSAPDFSHSWFSVQAPAQRKSRSQNHFKLLSDNIARSGQSRHDALMSTFPS
jgi:hypothetical protein